MTGGKLVGGELCPVLHALHAGAIAPPGRRLHRPCRIAVQARPRSLRASGPARAAPSRPAIPAARHHGAKATTSLTERLALETEERAACPIRAAAELRRDRSFGTKAGLSRMAAVGGGLNRSTQHFILERKDGVYCDVPKISSRLHCGREDGVMGPLAAWGVLEGDWASIW